VIKTLAAKGLVSVGPRHGTRVLPATIGVYSIATC
jgi:DNA-binding FadR family transcriptional regulator